MVKWIITKYQHSWVDNRLLVLVWTDQPIHAFLHYSLSPEIFAYITSERRGIRRLVKPLWELANPITLEQPKKGDTLCHAFYIPAVPDQATLTFYISATNAGIEAKSISIPIKIQHPNQDEADPIDPPDLSDCLESIPWQENIFSFLPVHHDWWNKAGTTGTGALSHNESALLLFNGANTASWVKAYLNQFGDVQLRYQRRSQLRAVISLTSVDYDTHAQIAHGSIDSGSGYGFTIHYNIIYGFTRNPGGITYRTIWALIESGDVFLLEAKYDPGNEVEWWVNGEYRTRWQSDLPTADDLGPRVNFFNPSFANSYLALFRLMIWQQSLYTGPMHE